MTLLTIYSSLYFIIGTEQHSHKISSCIQRSDSTFGAAGRIRTYTPISDELTRFFHSTTIQIIINQFMFNFNYMKVDTQLCYSLGYRGCHLTYYASFMNER